MRFFVAAFALLAAFALFIPVIQGQGACFIAYPMANSEGKLWQTLRSESSALNFAHDRFAAVLRSASHFETSFVSDAHWTGCTAWVPPTDKIMDDQELLSYSLQHLQACKPENTKVNFDHDASTASSRWIIESPLSTSRPKFSDVLSIAVSVNGRSSFENGQTNGPDSSASMTLSLTKSGSRIPHTVLQASSVVLMRCDAVDGSDVLARVTRDTPDQAGPTASTPLIEPISSPVNAPLATQPVEEPQTEQPTAATPIAPVTIPTATPVNNPAPINPPQATPAQNPPTTSPSPVTTPVPQSTPVGPTPTSPVAPTPVSPGSCVFSAPAMQQVFDLNSAYYGAAGQGIRVSPYRAPNQIDESIIVDLTMRGIHEISRSSPGCAEPGVAFSSNTELSNSVRSLNLSFCDCEWSRRTIEVVPGTMEEQFIVSFDCSRLDAIWNDFKLRIIYKNPHQDYSLNFAATKETINQGFGYNYTANALSFGVEVENWPWNPSTLNKRTYVVLDFLFNVHLLNTSCSLGYSRNQSGNLLDLTTPQSYISVFADRGYAINGIPYVSRVVSPVPFSAVEIPHGTVDDLTALRHQFCTEVNYEASNWTSIVKWQNATYDPSFTAFFFGDTPKDLTPKEASNKRAAAIAAGVVVGLVVVVCASLGVIIFAYRNHRDREASRLTAQLNN